MFNIFVDPHIKLRLLETTDANELFLLVDNNRQYLREWLPWVDQIYSPYQYQNIIPMWQQLFTDRTELNAGIYFHNRLVGMISIQQIEWANRKASIGYYLAEDAQGNGIMAKSVAAILNYAFYYLKLNRMEILCGVKNHKSQAIPEKLLFQKEGMIRDGEFLYDHYHDLYSYSMLAREWASHFE
ncbi:GNAT family N-acetyltransferase [Bacillus sp. B1-b2]|uniref:GNAT family N-acetyltransferase n=1 Tax=Bacillus sp. B1-b2 TaxID=2653201 RepID=UPI001261A99A|nr:GNAT family protein [Bacillus sp. B1-b2]KAB7666872.1 GNAT family N-acetyltransferase [Bacillus sp. B1-b2]